MNNIMLKIMHAHRSIKEIKTIHELNFWISDAMFEKTNFCLLFIWIISPVIVMLLSISLDADRKLNALYNHLFLSVYWHVILQQVGYIGCIIGIYIFIKSCIQAKASSICFSRVITANPVPFFLFMMLIWSVASSLLSSDYVLSLRGTDYRHDGLLTYFAYAGVFCCGYSIRDQKRIKFILELLVTVATLLSLTVLLDNIPMDQLFGLTTNASVFYNINHFGYFLCLALISAMTLFVVEDRTYLLYFRGFLLAIMAAAMIKNRSFGPYLAIVFGMLCFLAISFRFHKGHFKRILIAVSIFASVSLLMNVFGSSFYNDLFVLSGDVWNIMNRAKESEYAGSGRWPLWVNGFRFIVEKPLFGYGPENLGVEYAKVGIKIDRPHNELLQFGASLGIPALALYVSGIWAYFYNCYKNRKQFTVMMTGVFCAILAYLFSSMVGNTMFNTTPFFFMMLGLSAGVTNSLDSLLDSTSSRMGSGTVNT